MERKLLTRGHRIAAIAGIEQGSIPAIFAVVRIVSTCFQKIAGIAGVVHSDPNDGSDYMETRLKLFLNIEVVATSESQRIIDKYFLLFYFIIKQKQVEQNNKYCIDSKKVNPRAVL